MAEEREGTLTIDEAGHEIYYRMFGEGPETLVGLHGGPGADHRYLARLGELAGDELQVLLYDQLGSGKSDRPDDPSLWVVPRFVEELETVRTSLELGPVHILGQSWGGILALQYALDHPEAVKSLVLSNTGSSVAEIFRGMTQLRLDLGADEFTQMVMHEGSGDVESPEYQALVMQLYARHLRRSTPFEIERSIREFEEIMVPLMDLGPAYFEMWGPHEFLLTGSLAGWDVTDRLGEIDSPALIVCGWYDEVDVRCHRILADGIRDNTFVIFGNSSHCTIVEKEGDTYLAVVKDFVRRASA
jgi:proline iminopeptidase